METRELFHRVLRAHMRLPAAPARVFPLLCPVREAEWLPGWQAEVLHSVSGVAELGCVFRTRDEDGRERVWTITRHDPAAGVVQFAQFLAGLCVIRLDIQLEPDGPGTLAHWTYTVAALEPGHPEFFEYYSEAGFQARMARLGGLLEAFLAAAPARA
jgi:hypothetical protein